MRVFWLWQIPESCNPVFAELLRECDLTLQLALRTLFFNVKSNFDSTL